MFYWSLPGTWHFLLIGSKTKGSLCPEAWAGSSPIDLGASILDESTFLTMAFKKPAVWTESASVSRPLVFSTYSTSVPPLTTPLQPAKMASSISRTHYDIRILLDLRIRHTILVRNRVIPGIQTQRRRPNRKHTISGARVPVISILRRVAPRGTLHLVIELVQIFHIADPLCIDVLQLVGMSFEEFAGAGAHCFTVDVQTEVAFLEAQIGDDEVPGVCDDDRSGEEAVVTCFA